MDRQQLGIGRGRRPSNRTLATTISIAERGERASLEAPHAGVASVARPRGTTRLGCRGIVESADALPATFGAGEDVGLAVVTGRYDGFFGCPTQTDEGEAGHFDRMNGGATGIDDGDGAVVA